MSEVISFTVKIVLRGFKGISVNTRQWDVYRPLPDGIQLPGTN